MKKGKIIEGALSCLMLCGLLVGCSSNTDSSEDNTQSTTSSTVSTVSKNDFEATTVPYEKGTITETEFTSKWMGLKYTLSDYASGDNIVILTEELSSLASIDEKRYLEISKPQIETLADKVMFDEVRQRIVAGETFYELPYHLSMEIDGTSVTLDQTFLCKKLDDRMICMTLTHSGENSINNLLAGFSKIS